MVRSVLIISFILLLDLSAQIFRISGTVNDENDQPLVGANVFLKGTIVGTATNSRGDFELSKLKKKNYSLIISMIGYEQKKIIDYLDKQVIKINGLVKETKNSIELLKEHRSALISAAVTGKIDVRNFEKEVA